MTRSTLITYPIPIQIKKKTLQVRPLQRSDEPELLAFFKRLPVDERRMLKDDVTNPAVIAAWCAKIDLRKVMPLLAFDGPRIVGDASLHRNHGTAWSRHVAALRVTIDPDYRRWGVGRALIRTLLDVAEPEGVAIVDAEIMAEQRGAIAMFEDLGFTCIATLPQHVIDLNYHPHDLVVMSKTLIPVERLSPDAWKSTQEVDIGGGG